MENIKKAFERFTTLDEVEWKEIFHIMKPKEFKNGEFFIKEGQTCKYVGFVSSGLFRYYYQTDGQQLTRQFFFENNFMANYQSYITGGSSIAYIEALENSEVILIPREDLFRLFETSMNFQRLGRKVAEFLFMIMSAKYESFLLQSAEERYLSLIKNRPKVIKNIPQYMIASYLGITPEGFSRIRKRIVKG
ncbi:MAG: Crp/Fnr family transcriptional regulator [Bacteroidota bacterium]